MENFWDTVGALSSTREANVETWLVLPLLEALGHDRRFIDSKVPVLFQEGRSLRPGRRPEADFVVYAELPFSRATSLIVVETKRPDETLDGGREQGESYAQNLRTPILLMTNGVRLEIWQLQIATDSMCVLKCDIADLKARRGDIEGLISREAIKAHCANIEYKRFDLAARDLLAYERAEHDRVSPKVRGLIPRTLRGTGTTTFIRSTELINTQPRGAVIVGDSGFGKTMLAQALLYQGLERRWNDESTALPIEIFLPDLSLSGVSLRDFIAGRIAAHKPSFSPSILETISRDAGLLVIADGFERVSHDSRDEIESVLRTFLRDYPRCQIFVMTRTALLIAELPSLILAAYTPDDLYELGRVRAIGNPALDWAFRRAPEYVYRIGEVPLLADLILDKYARDHQHTMNLVSLYEAWIDQMLLLLRLVDRALGRAVLEEISAETVDGPITIGRALELCGRRSDPEAALSQLIDVGAISVRGTSVELRHEALADYLRATSYWKSSRQPGAVTLDALSFDSSSQFGLLLVATAPTRVDRGAAWQAVSRADMQLAIHSLRFAAGSELLDIENQAVEAAAFLTDINTTIENLISSHLKPVGHLLRKEVAGASVKKLGISGSVSAEDVAFSFFEADGASASVQLDPPDREKRKQRYYGHALRRVGYGPEAGRILGARRVENALIEQVKARTLAGGKVWIEELVFGRLRHIFREYDAPVSPLDLPGALRILNGARRASVGGGLRRGQSFLVNDLIVDIKVLIGQGITSIPVWSEGVDSLDLNAADDRDRFSQIMNEYYRRVQLAYSEVAEHSFPKLRKYLSTLAMMPFRYEIEVEFHDRRGYEDMTLHYRRFPVASDREAGADVAFPDKPTDFNDVATEHAYFERIDALMAQFGRSSARNPAQWGGCGIPDFDGQDITFGGLSDESVVVRTAMEWMKNDIEDVFSEIPSYRMGNQNFSPNSIIIWNSI